MNEFINIKNVDKFIDLLLKETPYVNSVIEVVSKQLPKVTTKKVELNNNIKKENKLYNGNEKISINDLVNIVPPEIRELIELGVDYYLSGPDKIIEAMSYIAQDIQIDRMSPIVSGEKTIVVMKREIAETGNISLNSKEEVKLATHDIANAIDGLKEKIKQVAQRINNIPTQRRKRLMNISVKDTLEAVQVGKNDVYFYARGVLVLVDLTMKMGYKQRAILELEDAINFLSDMRDKQQFERVEQWNKEKDYFWITGINKVVETLNNKLTQINYYKQLSNSVS